MWGVRVLHNFGKLGIPVDTSDDPDKTNLASTRVPGLKRVDEEDAVEGGLKGRLSAGAEFYFSAKERSAGGQSKLFYLPTFLNHSLQFRPEFDLQLFRTPPHLHFNSLLLVLLHHFH
jgi:distribution and morphology protein 10